jgi:peptide/nickel transport system permease protein
MRGEALRAILRSPSGAVGVALLLLALAMTLAGPLMAPYDPTRFHPSARLAGPSGAFWLGTDQFGRDLLSRVLHGAPATILFGLAATALATAAGTLVGLVSGFLGGRADAVIMRVNDALLAIPTLVFALLVVTVLGASTANAVLAVAVATAPHMARIARGVTLSVRERDFVKAAVARGERAGFLLAREILPNVGGAVIVEATIRVAFAIMAGATLSFLGLGAQPPASDWGLMVAEARQYMFRNPWTVAAPGLAIALVAVGFNLFGDALRDALNPRAAGT